MKRHRDALGIQEGARNVRAIARSLVEASDEAAREGIGAEQDPAVRMIVHRLARLCKVQEIDNDFDPATLRDIYCLLMEECERRAAEGAEAPTETEVTIVLPNADGARPAGPATVSLDVQQQVDRATSSTSPSAGASRPV